MPFQTKSLLPEVIQTCFESYLQDFPSASCIIATDASKDASKTAIAAINLTDHIHLAYLIHHLNSVFTADVLAIDLTLTKVLTKSQKYIIITESKSALSTLQNIMPKFPIVILHLFHTLRTIQERVTKNTFLWVPGHVGISANEREDNLAEQGLYATVSYI